MSDDSVLFAGQNQKITHKELKEGARKVFEQEGDTIAVFGNPGSPEIFMNGKSSSFRYSSSHPER